MNYSCARDENITKSFFWTMHLTIVISQSINIVGLYCVIFKSPSYMQKYKWCVVHHMFWIMVLDIHITTLIIPDFLFPLAAANIMGLLIKVFPTRVIAACGFYSAGALIATLLHLFVYRHQVILPEFHKHHLSKWSRISLLTAIYIYFPGAALPISLMIPSDQYSTKLKIAHGSCVPKELFFEETVVIDQDHFLFSYLYMIMFLFVAAFLASGLMIDAFHFLNSSMSHLSSQVKQLHISVLRTLIMQISVPALLLGVPMGTLLLANILKYTNQVLTCAVMQIVAFHGTMATVTMILLSPSYRRFIFQSGERIKTVQVTPIITVTHIRDEVRWS